MNNLNNSSDSVSSSYLNNRNENPQNPQPPHANVVDVAKSSLPSSQAPTGVKTRSQTKVSISPIPSTEIVFDPEETTNLVKTFNLLESICLEKYRIDFSVIQAVDQQSTVLELSQTEVIELEKFNAETAKMGIPSYLSLVKIDEEIGHGVFLNPIAKPIPKGSIVGVYAGKIKLTSSNEHLGPYVFHIVKCSKKSEAYLKWIEENPKNKDPLVSVDAEEMGNYTRFINHTKENNANLEYCYRRYVSKDDSQEKIAIIFKAKKDILPGQQLLYDYGSSYWIHEEPTSITPSTYTLSKTMGSKSSRSESSKATETSSKMQKVAREGIGRSNDLEIRSQSSADERERKEPAIAPSGFNRGALSPHFVFRQHQEPQFPPHQGSLSLAPPPPLLYPPYRPLLYPMYNPFNPQTYYPMPYDSSYSQVPQQSSNPINFGQEAEIPFTDSSSQSNSQEHSRSPESLPSIGQYLRIEATPFASSSSQSNSQQQSCSPESFPSIGQHPGIEASLFASSSSSSNSQNRPVDSEFLSAEELETASRLIEKWIGSNSSIPNVLLPNEYDQNKLQSQILKEIELMMKFVVPLRISAEPLKFFALLKIQACLCLHKRFPTVKTDIKMIRNGFSFSIKFPEVNSADYPPSVLANEFGNSILRDMNTILNSFRKQK